MDRELRDMISHGASVDVIRDWSRQANGSSLLQHAVSVAEEGIVSLDEVVRVITGN